MSNGTAQLPLQQKFTSHPAHKVQGLVGIVLVGIAWLSLQLIKGKIRDMVDCRGCRGNWGGSAVHFANLNYIKYEI